MSAGGPIVLLFGANGQVGRELLHTLGSLGTVVAATRSGALFDGSACQQADFDEPASLSAVLERVRPSVVVNAAACTAVDRAESERDIAWRVNAEAPGAMARWCAAAGVPLVHYSTDYVFDGRGTRPYREGDTPAPLGVYGASKLAGEDAVRASGGRYLVLRTAWVYAAHSANFLRTMLRAGGERDHLRVVSDQFGTPTPARLIAEVTAVLLRHPGEPCGTWHLTATGQTSWHGFATAIFDEACAAGVLTRRPVIEAISSAEYPAAAKRPRWSVLDTAKLRRDFDVALPSWQDGLKQVMAEIAAGDAQRFHRPAR